MSNALLMIFKVFAYMFKSLFRLLFRKQQRFPLINKTVLVTGAGNGLGRELALNIAGKNNMVVLMDIDERAAKEVAEEIKNRGQKCHIHICDVSNKQDIEKAVKVINAAVGPIDVLINNAGIAIIRPFLELSDNEIERAVQINLLSLFWMIRAFLPEMINRGSGHIVNIASGLGITPAAKMTAYCATKSGVLGLHESIRMELEQNKLQEKISMTYVCPGVVKTRMMPRPDSCARDKIVPPIAADYLANEIVDAIEKREESLLRPKVIGIFAVLHSILPVKTWVWMHSKSVLSRELRSTASHSTLPFVDQN